MNQTITKKQIKAIAKIINNTANAGELKYAGSVAYRFANYFKTQKSKFAYHKFVEECLK